MHRLLNWCGILLLVSGSYATTAFAQAEQWLGYRSASRARDIHHNMIHRGIDLKTEKPEGLALPKFETDNPVFGAWSSPLAPKGTIPIAVERSSRYLPYDRLWVDTNSNGRLDDETVVKAHSVEQHESRLGPVPVSLEFEGEPITYHLNFTSYNYGDGVRLHVTSGGWYEGPVVVGQENMYCVLIDRNGDGRFDGTSIGGDSDQIKLGHKKDHLKTMHVGTYVHVGDDWYTLEVAPDGAFIKLNAAENLRLGSIRVPQNITELAAYGQNGSFQVRLDKGLGKLPVGKYRIDNWTIARTVDNEKWRLQGRGLDDRGLFDVTADGEAKLDIGEPIAITLDSTAQGRRHNFNHSLKGKLGEYIAVTRNGRELRESKLRVKSAQGDYNKTFTFEYG